MTFHTRNHFPIDEIQRGEKQAQSQAEKILEFFEMNPLKKMTPFDVAFELFTVETPITSIRRSLTDLTTAGKLVKLEHEQVKGKYGVSNCLWMKAPNDSQVELF